MKKLYLQKFRKTKSILFTLLLQMLALAAFSQARISGKVTGPDGTAVSGISVVLRNTNFGASTDANGTYIITADVKPGNYFLDFTGVGFKSKEQALQIGSAARSLFLPKIAPTFFEVCESF